MKMLNRLPIRYQLRLIVLIMAIPMVGFIINNTIREKKDAIHDAIKETQSLADKISYEYDITFYSAKQLLLSLSQLPEARQLQSDKLSPLLNQIRIKNPDIANIIIADLTGEVLASAEPTTLPIYINDRRYFLNAIHNEQLASGEYVVSRAFEKPTFNFGYPIKDINGNIIGVIAIGLSLDKFASIFPKSELPKDASFSLLDNNGIILFRAIEPYNYIGKQTDPELFKKIISGPDDHTDFGISVATGDERIITTRKFYLTGEKLPYMYLRVGIPVESALSAANKELLKNVTVFSLVLLSAFIFSTYIGKHSIISKISVLIKASQSLANGDSIIVSDHVKGGELGDLAESFDIMSVKLIHRETALKKSEERYRNIVESQTEFVDRNLPGGILTYVNPALAKYTGVEAEALLGKSFYQFIHEADRDEIIRLLESICIENPSVEIKSRIVLPDGKIRWTYWTQTGIFDNEGRLVECQAVGKDITEQIHAEEALREANEFLTLTIKSAGSAMWAMDCATGHLYWSPEQFLMLGLEPANSANYELWKSMVHPDDLNLAESNIINAMNNHTDFFSEYRIIKPSGEIRWINAFGQTIYDALNVPQRMYGICLDITDRKKAEEEKMAFEKQLLHSQKLESLGIMAGGVAHDFNNLLQSILGNIELAARELTTDSSLHKYISDAMKAGGKATHLSSLMLTYAGNRFTDKKALNLNKLASENTDIFQSATTAAITIEMNLAEELPAIIADDAQLQQVVMNLITNAAESIVNQTGIIKITTGIQECDQSDMASNIIGNKLESGCYVFIEISDNGCGMDMETIKRLFDPFFTTKFTGRGLGMSAVMGIMKSHDGGLFLQSETGKGTTFRAIFPATDSFASTTESCSALLEQPASQVEPLEGLALIVDDDKSVLRNCATMVRLMGLKVITASDGRDALSKYRQQADEIDVVLLDLTMPNMDGITAMGEIYKIQPNAKILLASGFNKEELEKRVTSQPSAGFIRKPYSMNELEAEIRKVLGLV